MPSYSTEPDVIAIHSQLYDHSSKTSNDTRYRDRTIQEHQSISKTIITITKYIQPCLSKYSDCFFLVSTLLVYFIPLSDCFSSYSVFYSIFFSVPFFVPSLSFHSSFDFLCHSVYSFLLFSFLLFILLPTFLPITLFSISAHLRNSIISRLYIPPINILECATNSNREGEPIIRNEGINQSPLEEVKSKKKKKKKYRNIDGSNVIITQSPRNSNARREIVSSHRDPTASTEDAAKHDRIGRPDKTSNLLSRPFLIGLLLLPTSSAGSTARIIYAKLM